MTRRQIYSASMRTPLRICSGADVVLSTVINESQTATATNEHSRFFSGGHTRRGVKIQLRIHRWRNTKRNHVELFAQKARWKNKNTGRCKNSGRTHLRGPNARVRRDHVHRITQRVKTTGDRADRRPTIQADPIIRGTQGGAPVKI